MKNKAIILIFLNFWVKIVEANMASPITEGTMSSSVFTSKDINILNELIYIKIDKDFKTANFIIEYIIQSDVNGYQIPLLFHAKDYKDSFFVWVDNKKVNLQNIPEKYTHFRNSPFKHFNIKNHNQDTKEIDEISIYWNKNFGFSYKINDLKYFETNLTKGIHKIRVEYTSVVWENRSGWVKEYSFRYSLTPAKFWKSFGKLNIKIEQQGVVKKLKSNIGKPIEKIYKKNNNWTFSEIPNEYLEFSYTPPINNFAHILIIIQPLGLSIILGIILFLIHLHFIKQYRKSYTNKKYSIVVILGSIIVPFLLILAFIYSFDFIEYIIGVEAGSHNGYMFLGMIIYYPIIVAIFWIYSSYFDDKYKIKYHIKYEK